MEIGKSRFACATKKIQGEHVENQMLPIGMDKSMREESPIFLTRIHHAWNKQTLMDDVRVLKARDRRQYRDGNDDKGYRH